MGGKVVIVSNLHFMNKIYGAEFIYLPAEGVSEYNIKQVPHFGQFERQGGEGGSEWEQHIMGGADFNDLAAKGASQNTA